MVKKRKMTKKNMTKWIAFLVFICIAVIVCINIFSNKHYDYSYLVQNEVTESGTEFQSLGSDNQIQNMVIAAENEQLVLYVNEKTTEIAVRDKRSNKIWYSNPQDRDQDSIANGEEKNNLSSQLIVSYYDHNRKAQVFNNYSDSIAREQFEIKSVQNGIIITYTFGDLSLGADSIPRFITPERFQSFLDKLDEKSRKDLEKRYFESTTNEGFMELKTASLKSKIVIKNMLEAFAQAGYTEADLQLDNQASGIEMEVNRDSCVIPVLYRLNDDKLSVTIPIEQMEETPGIKVSSIKLLKYFGAGDLKEQGYLVVPNGAGGIINFNNGKINDDAYFQPVYGVDSILQKSTKTQVTEEARMPIFGINKGNNGFIAYIENGDSIANINADISGKVNSYNVAYPSFNLRSTDALNISDLSGSSSDMTIIENQMIKNDIKVDYCFLPEGQADYSGMARFYQNILVNKGVLTPLEEKATIPMYLDLIGAIEKNKYFIGIPYNGLISMTNYEQANEILDRLEENGIQNIQLRYLGWFNNGVNHDVAKKVNPEGILGSRKELKELQSRLQSIGGKLYPDVAFQLIRYKSSNYSESKEAARYLDGTSGVIADYNRSFLRMDTYYDAGVYQINSPKVLPDQINQFTKSYRKLGLQNLSLRDLGSILSSDKKSKEPVNLEIAKRIVEEQLGKLASQYDQILMTGGNAYALRYTKNLINIPDTGNQFFIVDEEIPFYQMVIHGFIDYAGDAINLLEDYDQKNQQLKMIEYGMAPHYVWTYMPTSDMNQTAYEEYYSTQYNQWLDDAIQNYTVLNDIYKATRTSKILKHIILEKGVHEIIYDNGTTIYINYNDTAKKVNHITIEAKGYVLGGEK